MTHPGEGLLQRYGLGELDARGCLDVEAHLDRCEGCRTLVDTERRLDDLLVRSAAPPPPRGARRDMFETLWDRVDQGPAADPPPPAATEASPRPRGIPAVLLPRLAVALAAGLLLTLVLVIDDTTPEAPAPAPLAGADQGAPAAAHPAPAAGPVASEPTPATASPATASPGAGSPGAGSPGAGSPGAGSPGTLATGPAAGTPAADDRGPTLLPAPFHEPALEDEERLRVEAARDTVARVLGDADARFPELDEAFRVACEDGFADLRAEGLRVTHLVRGHALGSRTPDDVRFAALRWSVLDPDGDATLAAALGRSGLEADVLALLARRPDAPLSHGLAAALEEQVLSLRPGDAEALDLLVRHGEARSLESLALRLVDRLETGTPVADDVPRALALLARCPAPGALLALVHLGDDPRRASLAQEAFARRVAGDRPGTVAALEALWPRVEGPTAVALCAGSALHELSPALVGACRDPELRPAALEALARMGDTSAAAPLFGLWRERRQLAHHEPVEAALRALLERDEAARAALGAAVGPAEVDDLVALCEALPDGLRAEPLLACLAALPPASDVGGYRAFLARHVARLGGARDGRRLLAWIEATAPGDPRLAAVAWAAATVLTPEATRAWDDSGRDPDVLAAVTDHGRRWPHATDHLPSRVLRDLDRSLRREAPSSGSPPLAPPR